MSYGQLKGSSRNAKTFYPGITDYTMKIKESNVIFLPQNGTLKARLDSIEECKSYIDKIADMASFMLTAFNEQHKQGWDLNGDYKFVDENGDDYTVADESTLQEIFYLYSDGTAVTNPDDVVIRDGKYYIGTTEVTKINEDTMYMTTGGTLLTKVPDTINFFGKGSIEYEYRYDEVYDKNYLYKYDSEFTAKENLLSGVRIVEALEVNSIFSQERGDRYVAAATSQDVVETLNSDGSIKRTYIAKQWGERTADGTNAVYLSELFNISHDTILSDAKPNKLVSEKFILRDLDGNAILASDGSEQQTTVLTRLSFNAFYQNSMSTLGIDAYSTDVNYEALQNVMTQVNNWRDSTSGVDWNEELTNMIKFQKGFTACSRCLNAMDECLDRLVSSTGVVGR